MFNITSVELDAKTELTNKINSGDGAKVSEMYVQWLELHSENRDDVSVNINDKMGWKVLKLLGHLKSMRKKNV